MTHQPMCAYEVVQRIAERQMIIAIAVKRWLDGFPDLTRPEAARHTLKQLHTRPEYVLLWIRKEFFKITGEMNAKHLSETTQLYGSDSS